MFEMKIIFQKLVRLSGITASWWLLCGIDRSPKEMKFGLKDLQTKNMLQSMPPLTEIPLSFYFLALAFVGSIIGVIFLVRYHHKKKIQDGLDQIAIDQAQLALDSEFEARQVEEEDREFFPELCNTSDPIELLPVIMSSEKFEKIVEDYKKSDRFSKLDLARIFMLRKSLQFTFKNTAVGFSCSQMIEPGTHLECQIHHKGKNVVFITTVLDSNETQLLIKPPTVKRRPANMKQFSELYCNIRRGEDADYEFKFKIIGQLAKDLNAVILRHTNNIHRLHIRVSERLPIDLEMDFQLLTEEQYEAEQEFDVGKLQHHTLSGKIKDMSAGGIKVQLGEMPPQGINKGDAFLFHLPYASLHGNITATVVDMVSHGELNDIHCKFSEVDMLTRMKLNQYLHRKKLSMEAA